MTTAGGSVHLQFDRPPGAEAERPGTAYPGIPVLVVVVVVLVAATAGIVASQAPVVLALSIAAYLLAGFGAAGLFMLRPGIAGVMTLFGSYRGSIRQPGLWWSNPFYAKQRLSLRVRNFDTDTAKVNDANGNPVEIGAVVVWQVVDTAKAAFQVEDIVGFVAIQSEAAVRSLAREYPYDTFDDVDEGAAQPVTLIGNADDINHRLDDELQERLEIGGVRVVEARLTHLSYAPEIAEAMLRRQQASAIVAARKKIVEGAVWMVRAAVEQLESGSGTGSDAITLDEDRRATFASNLMTVIASDNPTSPVVNVGTLTR